MEMTKRERLEATICGEAVDRLAIALWRHFPVDDQSPQELAISTAAFQRQYDFDFVKVTPASSFCVRDWGAEDVWQGEPEGTRAYTRRPIKSPEDWRALPRLDPRAGALGNQLRCLELIKAELGSATPFIQTIFNPLSQAKNLAGGQQMLVDMRRAPQMLKAGLETIADTTIRFIEEAKRTGIAGIFLAVQHASYALMSEAEYAEFGRPYDLRLLEAADGLWLNVLHLHGDAVMFDLLADYPLHVWNWHDRETPPTLHAALPKIKGAVCGGIERDAAMLLGTPELVREKIADAVRQTGGRRYIIGTGCVTRITTPLANLRAAKEACGKAAPFDHAARTLSGTQSRRGARRVA
jgi:uroporphyrinogen decarboxylase